MVNSSNFAERPTMPDAIRNVFISHIHEDDEGLSNLKSLLEKNGLQIRDSEVDPEIRTGS